MIPVVDKNKCSGCQACVNICAHGCISMEADGEGFLYPHIDHARCIGCGLCRSVCPSLRKPDMFVQQQVYAARHGQTEILLKSSSGGVFSALAEEILKEKGVVFGACFDERYRVFHQWVDNESDLDKLRRSKYVQSDIGQSYRQAHEFLEQGRRVLFVGTPCQIAGLRNYLNKDYAHLLTAQLICLGVASTGVWQRFLRENFPSTFPQEINFRKKDGGWSRYFLGFRVGRQWVAHSQKQTLAEKIFSFFSMTPAFVFHNLFLRGYLAGLFLRPSCHLCLSKDLEKRMADVTLGDLWGEWPDILTPKNKHEGVSFLGVNTPKGAEYVRKSGIKTMEIDARQAMLHNPAIFRSCIPHAKRSEFFVRWRKEPLNALLRELLGIKPFCVTLVKKIYQRFFDGK